MKKQLILISIMMLLTACVSATKSNNFIEKEVSKLELGDPMSKAKSLVGTPASVAKGNKSAIRPYLDAKAFDVSDLSDDVDFTLWNYMNFVARPGWGKTKVSQVHGALLFVDGKLVKIYYHEDQPT